MRLEAWTGRMRKEERDEKERKKKREPAERVEMRWVRRCHRVWRGADQ